MNALIPVVIILTILSKTEDTHIFLEVVQTELVWFGEEFRSVHPARV